MHPRLLGFCASFCLSLRSQSRVYSPSFVWWKAAAFSISSSRSASVAKMSSQQQPHTAAEIRAKRLAALEGHSISTGALVAMLQQPSATANGGSSKREQPDAAAGKAVIDLCDSDDEDQKLSGNERKRKHPSTDRDDKPSKASSKNIGMTSSKSGAAASNSSANQSTAAASASFSSSSAATTSFRLITYNVWFGPNGDANPHCEARMKAITRLCVAEPQTLFIGLQEVTDQSLPILATQLRAAGYETIVQSNGAPYYCVLAVRQLARDAPLMDGGWVSYGHSRMGRGFCYARLRLQRQSDAQVIVATTHLESYTGKESTGARERVDQMMEFGQWAWQQMQEHAHIKYAVIMGDLNWDDESRNPNDGLMTSVLSECDMPFKDAWLSVQRKKSEKCYTYDPRDNPMLGGNNLRRRFDRAIIFARHETAHAQLHVLGTKLIGTEALPGLTFQKLNTYTQTYLTKPVAPSDHFGFVSELKLGL
ncbi:hypothetical protein MPSEU_000646700 [Mayamaea pseudoterrestris]|nr:hypothetical protein MPSEU_000646700 [Mayamaea pseudoterrestris]